MTRATQTLLLAVTGAVLVRMAAGDSYLRYVSSWMRWPLIVCGVFLIVLALADLWREQGSQDDGHDTHVPRAAWLLFAPSLVFFLVAPPALGAHFAERAQNAVVPVQEAGEVALPPLPEGDTVPLTLDDVLFRAAYDDGATLADRRLELTGFVSRDTSGTWYITQFGINCCAADATVTRVAASGVAPPPDDQWVRVVATHVPGTGDGGVDSPEVTVEELELIEAPKNQYS